MVTPRSALSRAEQVMGREWGPTSKHWTDYIEMRARIYGETNRLAEAERLYRRSLQIAENAFGADHPSVATTLDGLASLLRTRGDYGQAEELFRRALRIREAAFGSEHPDVARMLSHLAALRLAARDTAGAFDLARKAVTGFSAVLAKGGDDAGGIKVETLRPYLNSLLQVLERAVAEQVGGAEATSDAMKVAQLSTQTAAAAALTKMAARVGAGSSKLATLARDLQDATGELQAVEKAILEAVLKAPKERNPGHEQHLRRREAELKQQVQAINARLAAEFPDYAALASPKPLTVAEVQSSLRADDALVYFLDTRPWKPVAGATFLWAITKKDARFVRIELDSDELGERVQALRCGLDATLWTDASTWPESTQEELRQKTEQIARRQRCKTLLGAEPTKEVVAFIPYEVLPFDAARAHALYRTLLGPVEDLVKGKRLIVVPSGPLTTVPFNVLVTEQPIAAIPARLADYREIAWLGARTGLSVLPSVASLKALRQFAKRSQATRPYLGIGNPLLDGPQNDPRWGSHYRELAKAARDRTCTQPSGRQRVASAKDRGSAGGFGSSVPGCQCRHRPGAAVDAAARDGR